MSPSRLAAGHYDGDGCTFPTPGHLAHAVTAPNLPELARMARAAQDRERCGRDGRHPVPDGDGIQTCPCGTVSRHPAPTKEPA